MDWNFTIAYGLAIGNGFLVAVSVFFDSWRRNGELDNSLETVFVFLGLNKRKSS